MKEVATVTPSKLATKISVSAIGNAPVLGDEFTPLDWSESDYQDENIPLVTPNSRRNKVSHIYAYIKFIRFFKILSKIVRVTFLL